VIAYSTAGRFENAPAHLIIDSTMFSSYSARPSESHLSEEELEELEEKRARDRERKHAARQAANTERERAREVQASADRAERERRSQAAKEEAAAARAAAVTVKKRETARLALERARARKQTKEYKEREAVRARAKRAREAPKVPEGYVLISVVAAKGGMSASGFNNACELGLVPAMKIGRNWYIDQAAAKEYAAGKADRARQRLYKLQAEAKANGAEGRRQKKRIAS